MSIIDGIVVLISAITASVFAFRAGVAYAHRQDAKSMLCRHIWEPWEDCTVSDYEYINGSKTKVFKPAQSRDCMSCGVREARRVTA